MPEHKDYDESETTNLFGDDYITAELYDEEDEEIGTDFHEIQLGNAKTADSEVAAYNKQRRRKRAQFEDVPGSINKKPRYSGSMTERMKAKGYVSVVIEFEDKFLILK